MLKTFIIFMILMLPITLRAEIYDCFTFFNELELLKVRFEELYDTVDHFVIVESGISFTGKSKPLYFAENAQDFEKYKDKIIHIVIDEFPGLGNDADKNHWKREEYSRNAILQGLTNCKENDIIFISDVDEIPRATIIPQIKDYLGKLQLKRLRKKIQDNDFVCDLYMRLFMYQMNLENKNGWWGGSKASPYWIVKKYTPWGIKLFHHTKTPHKISDAGWHFNTMGGRRRALYKWINTGPLYNNEEALNELDRRDDLLEQSFQGQVQYNTVPVPIDNTFPKYFLENLDYFHSIGWIAN